MKIKNVFLSIALVFLGVCFPLASVHAVSCATAQSGNITISSSCTFDGTNDGAVGGNITVDTGITLTILAGQNIIVNQGNSFVISAAGAKIVIVDTGSMLIGRTICLPDADGDTYPGSTAASDQTLTATTCPAGTIARNAAIWQADCDEGNASYFAALTCYPNADGDAYYSITSHSVCGGATCAGVGESATPGTDCNDNDNTKYATIQCYANADNDGVYAKVLGTAFCGSTCAAAGQSATIGTDCCDTDARAKPGQSVYQSTARTGCGGFDFNCDNVETHNYTSGYSGSCGVCSNVPGSPGSCSWSGGSGGWSGADPGCGNTGNTAQPGMCNEMTSYPNCSITGCITGTLTQICL